MGGSGRKVGVFSTWAAVKKMKYQRLGGNKNVFLTFLRPGKSRVMAPADSGSGEGPFPGCRRPIVCSWHGLWGLCYKTVLLLSQGSAVTPQMLPTVKALPATARNLQLIPSGLGGSGLVLKRKVTSSDALNLWPCCLQGACW